MKSQTYSDTYLIKFCIFITLLLIEPIYLLFVPCARIEIKQIRFISYFLIVLTSMYGMYWLLTELFFGIIIFLIWVFCAHIDDIIKKCKEKIIEIKESPNMSNYTIKIDNLIQFIKSLQQKAIIKLFESISEKIITLVETAIDNIILYISSKMNTVILNGEIATTNFKLNEGKAQNIKHELRNESEELKKLLARMRSNSLHAK